MAKIPVALDRGEGPLPWTRAEQREAAPAWGLPIQQQ